MKQKLGDIAGTCSSPNKFISLLNTSISFPVCLKQCGGRSPFNLAAKERGYMYIQEHINRANRQPIHVFVVESYFATLVEFGIPISVCMQLQQGGLTFGKAQWTDKQTTSGFFHLHLPARAARCEFPSHRAQNQEA